MSHRTLLTVVGGVFAALLVVMLVTFDYNKDNAEAQRKATELIAAYDAAGLATPMDPDEVAKVLGDDGGSVCATAGSDQQLAYLKTQLGVGGAFYTRATDIDRNSLTGLLLIVTTYCPEKLPNVQDFVDGLDLGNVVRD